MFGWIERLSGIGGLRTQIMVLGDRLTERTDATTGAVERMAADVARFDGRLHDIERGLNDIAGEWPAILDRIDALEAGLAALDDRMSYDHGNLSLRIDALVEQGDRLIDRRGEADQRGAADRLRNVENALRIAETQQRAVDQTVDRLRTELLRLQHRFDFHAADAGKTAVALLERIEQGRMTG